MNDSVRFAIANPVLTLFLLVFLLVGRVPACAVPSILSTQIPTTPTAAAVFTFSEAMDTAETLVMFLDGSTPLLTTASWSAGSTVLTCAPAAPWPDGRTIWWGATGRSASGAELGGTTYGVFTGPAGNTGCDPSATRLSLTVSKGAMYEQTSTGIRAGQTCLLACLSLPCPRDATSVMLQTPPPAFGPPVGPFSMTLSGSPGHLTLLDCPVTAPVEFRFPNGDYVFNIQAATSNQQVTVNFPSSLTAPPSPRLSNYAAAQAIDPAQPFTLAWDLFAGGTAGDCIHVEIYGNVFKTPALGEAGALNGTATSIVIPANTLQPNHTYSGCVTFYDYTLLTNGTSHISLAYRSATTEFTLATTGGASYCPAITKVGWAGAGSFAFEVACPIGQALVAECRTNLASGQWDTLCATNSTTARVRFTDPAAGTRPSAFYRVRTNP